MEHLNYTQTAEFQQLPDVTQQLFTAHILEEHDANPATGSASSLLGPAPKEGGPVTGGTPPQQQAAPVPGVSMTPGTGPGGEDVNSSTNNAEIA